MSLSIAIGINGSPVADVTVQRVLSSERGMHSYTAEGLVDGRVIVAHFKHSESDGAVACARRALEAIEAASARGSDSPPRQYQRSDRVN